MNLVDYEDSSSEGENRTGTTPQQSSVLPNRKRKAEVLNDRDVESGKTKPPPRLPAGFHSLYATTTRASTSDDPSMHAGRTRQIPHVIGHWPTHAYLEWSPSLPELAVLDGLVLKSSQSLPSASDSHPVHSFLRSELGAQLPLHVSLSAPIVLKTEQKAPFQDCIVSQLRSSRIEPFSVKSTRLDWVANHDRSRFFLVVRLAKPDGDELNKLLTVCNTAAEQFTLPQLYAGDKGGCVGVQPHVQLEQWLPTDKSDAFHISIAWTLQDPRNGKYPSLLAIEADQMQHLKVSFSELKLKIGNAVADLQFVGGKGPNRG